MPAFRDQEVRFPFTRSAAAVDRSERARQRAVLRTVPLGRWTEPSRCAGWTVHDVVRHVVQMNELVVDAVEAAREGRPTRLHRFDPRTGPQELLAQAPPATPATTLADHDRTMRAVTETVAKLDGTDLLVSGPTGRQPWPFVVLHALFDALVHERDVTEPLGRSAAPTPDQLPVLAYVLLLAARVACLAGHEFAVTLDPALDPGGGVVRIAVHGAVVEVAPTPDRTDAVPVDPLRLLDALAGRGPLHATLAAPGPVLAALGLLGRNL